MSGALQHTPGPWEWFTKGGDDRPYLATPDRGRLYVMGFARKGMQGATPLFSQWEGILAGAGRARAGGIMHDGILLPDGRMHPDARLIAQAPQLVSALKVALGHMPFPHASVDELRQWSAEGSASARDVLHVRAAIVEATGSAA